jgi:hypothetical protein
MVADELQRFITRVGAAMMQNQGEGNVDQAGYLHTEGLENAGGFDEADFGGFDEAADDAGWWAGQCALTRSVVC